MKREWSVYVAGFCGGAKRSTDPPTPCALSSAPPRRARNAALTRLDATLSCELVEVEPEVPCANDNDRQCSGGADHYGNASPPVSGSRTGSIGDRQCVPMHAFCVMQRGRRESLHKPTLSVPAAQCKGCRRGSDEEALAEVCVHARAMETNHETRRRETQH